MAELEDWREELEGSVQQARFLTEKLTDAQFNWHPAPDRWSMAQCLGHLNRVNLLLLPSMERAIPLAPIESSAEFRVWHPTWIERMFIQTSGPNARFKVDVPKPFIPDPEGTLNEVMETFFAANARIFACMEQAQGHDLRRIKVASSLSPLIRFSLGAWFASSVVHTQYHVGQARQVKSESGFPAA